MTCAFCDIALGRAEAHIVWRTPRCMVFADHAPIRAGHVQIIPRAHYETFDELPEDLAAEIILLGQQIARVQKALYRVARVGFVFTGNDVAHAHAHVVPLHEKTDVTSLRYFEAGLVPEPLPRRATAADLEQTSRQMARALTQRFDPEHHRRNRSPAWS